MSGGILEYANRIKNVCKTLKVLPSNDSAFALYRRKLFAELQRLALTIGLEEREDGFDEGKHPRDENGRFASTNSNGPSPNSGSAGARKGRMKPETPVSFKNPGQVTKSRDGRPITHFDHDEEEMRVVTPIKLRDEFMDEHTLCAGDIKHLTVFAGKGSEDELKAAVDMSRQYGGKPEDWKHVKGIGAVKGRNGVEYEADIHWFENEGVGQVGWKIKQPRSEMSESQIYWKDK